MAETKEERAARLRKSKETDRARHDRERERESCGDCQAKLEKKD